MRHDDVHFSVLQEYLAARVGASMGDLYFWSNNFHAYTDTLNRMSSKTANAQRMIGELHDNRYTSQRVRTAVMFSKPDSMHLTFGKLGSGLPSQLPEHL